MICLGNSVRMMMKILPIIKHWFVRDFKLSYVVSLQRHFKHIEIINFKELQVYYWISLNTFPELKPKTVILFQSFWKIEPSQKFKTLYCCFKDKLKIYYVKNLIIVDVLVFKFLLLFNIKLNKNLIQ